jgi:hypothetical protein
MQELGYICRSLAQRRAVGFAPAECAPVLGANCREPLCCALCAPPELWQARGTSRSFCAFALVRPLCVWYSPFFSSPLQL